MQPMNHTLSTQPHPSASLTAMMMITMMPDGGVSKLFDFEGGCWWSVPRRNKFRARMVGGVSAARQRPSTNGYLPRMLWKQQPQQTPEPDSCARPPANNSHV
jgi:hypothetical protein